MKCFVTYLLIIFSFSAHALKKNDSCPILIEPGVSFGLIKLGMSRAEVSKLEMNQKKEATSNINQSVGVFKIQYGQKDEVIDIGAELGDLPDCLYLGKRKIPKSASSRELSKIFKDCKPEEVRMGGNIVHCNSLWITTGGWGGRQKTPMIRTHLPEYGKAL